MDAKRSSQVQSPLEVKFLAVFVVFFPLAKAFIVNVANFVIIINNNKRLFRFLSTTLTHYTCLFTNFLIGKGQSQRTSSSVYHGSGMPFRYVCDGLYTANNDMFLLDYTY